MSPRRFIRTACAVFSLLLCMLALSSSVMAQLAAEAFPLRWTGVDTASGNLQFTIELKRSPESQLAVTVPGVPLNLSVPPLISVTGSWTSGALSGGSAAVPGRATFGSASLTGSYYHTLGLLVIRVSSAPSVRSGIYVFAVSPNGDRMAGVTIVPGGGIIPALPLYAGAGDALPFEVVHALGQRSREPAAKPFSPKAELGMRLEAHRRQVIASMGSAAESAASSGGGFASSKPEARWVRQLEEYGARDSDRSSAVELMQLFRQRHFEPFFGKPLQSMSERERTRLAKSLRELITHVQTTNPADYYRSGRQNTAATMLADALGTRLGTGFDGFHAVVGSHAFDLIANWDDYMLGVLSQSGDYRLMESYRHYRQGLIGQLWTVESRARQALLVETESRAYLQYLLARIDVLGASALVDDKDDSLFLLAQLADDTHLSRLSQGDRETFAARHGSRLADVLPGWLATPRKELIDGPLSRATLIAGRDWYYGHASVLGLVADRPEMRDFFAALATARERSVIADFQGIEREFAARSTQEHLAAYYDSVRELEGVDKLNAPGWQALSRAVSTRLQTIQWEAHVKRVGEGPFGPQYPGAAYLNALYRNDLEQIRREDQLYLAGASSMLSIAAMDTPVRTLMQAMGFDVDHERLRAELTRATLVRALAGTYLLNFERAYPACLGSDAVEFTLTDKWVDDWGNTIAHRPQTTARYRVAARHRAVFDNLRGFDASMAVLSQSFRPDIGALRVKDIVDGLEQAMQDYPCSHPVMQQLESNMMAIFTERYLARSRPGGNPGL